jgi:hypothetical protein
LRTYRHIYALAALGVAVLMIAPGSALSKGLFDGDTTHVIPLDEGDFGRIPSAAAAIHLLDCRQTYKGALFTFGIDVYETAWRPVYAIEITGIHNTTIEAIDCPPGWQARDYPQKFDVGGNGLSFYTDSNPIMPGSVLAGFMVLSSTNRAVVRWYATEKSGILLGKVTRTVFTCPSSTVPSTWGSVKALYR